MMTHTILVSVGFLFAGALFVADALTPLGLLNFLVLQWFGVRLARMTECVPPGCWWNYLSIDEREAWLRSHTGYGVQRWIIPLTGWWSDYRYIARRS